ncbi:hypothetical protein QL093DRAFT_2639780 [Fusarium oxysporum]|nr:hypothetical protein QL093DRAFT_2639780 [Fusarium oxysporum]
MREGTGTDALFKLAFYADRIVLLDIVSPRGQVIDQIPPSALSACQLWDRDIRIREARRIDARNSQLSYARAWLRRIGSALHLKDFSGKKGFLRDLIGLEYEVNPNVLGEADDGQLGFIHIAFDQMVNRAKGVITSDIILWNALFEVNRKELDKDRAKPFHFRFKLEIQRRYTLVVKQLLAYIVRCMSFEGEADRRPFKLDRRQQGAYDIMMEHGDDLTDAWKEYGGDPAAHKVSRLLDLLESDILELYISIVDHFTKITSMIVF